MIAEEIAAIAQTACVLEVCAPKPGNVSPRSDFRDMRFEDFLASAIAIGPAMGDAARTTVGAAVLRAIVDTRRVANVNTNLGIALLLAPLACAAGMEGGPLRERLRSVLAGLTRDDARNVYEAIRLANPGGLGTADAQDVRGEPTVTLREAMALAGERDTVAREYVTDYDVTFRIAMPALLAARERGLGLTEAAVEAYLHVLAQVPDTLVTRKFGVGAAEDVSRRAQDVLRAEDAGRDGALDAFDGELRRHGRNPGTTADITAAALFAVLHNDREGS